MAVRYQISGRGAAEIATSVEDGVRTGALPPGVLLPAVRALADELGVAPNTVAAAYKTLRQRGIVETAGRNGTRVRHRPAVTTRGRVAVPAGVVDLASGGPAPELVAQPGSYREAGPLPELVELARARLLADGVDAATGAAISGAAITVTSGTLDAVERLLTTRLGPGDRVGIEDPGWGNLIDLVVALGLEAVPMPVDDAGPTVEGLRRALAAGVGAVVVTSRAQNPTGAALTPARAAQLRSLLATAPAVLAIEDDHAAELATEPASSLAGAGETWALVRSVSKPFGPDLRLAIVAGDAATVARLEGRLRLGAGWVSTILQRRVIELWSSPEVGAQVAAARDTYAARRAALLDALAARGIVAHGRTGINVWVPVADEAAALLTLRDAGFATGPGAIHRIATPPAIRITVSRLADPAQLERVADAIAAAVSAQPPAAGR